MPIQPQMRQVWDGMRGPYQLIMNGASSAADGALAHARRGRKANCRYIFIRRDVDVK